MLIIPARRKITPVVRHSGAERKASEPSVRTLRRSREHFDRDHR
jgi:hypothetical protein